MKKAAIFTLNGNVNYGNRLQNYALQEVLKSYGFSVETVINNSDYIDTNKSELSISDKLRIIRGNSVFDFVNNSIEIFLNKLNKTKHEKLKQMKMERFKQFTDTYIVETKFEIDRYNVPDNLGSIYDYYITGSDQVWNPYVRKGSPIDFLKFAPIHKRIAYAPSFGVSEIPEEYVDTYRDYIKDFLYLSIREENGAEIIKKLTGKRAEVLLDPTLLISKDKWLRISKQFEKEPKGKYLLTYFLGKIPSEYSKQIKEIANTLGLKIIQLGNYKQADYYTADPSEFIDIISKCEVFCTDSFHGAVFSIIFEKPFIIYQRKGELSMYSRIDTLLSKFELSCRKAENIKGIEDVVTVDFSKTNKILENEKQKAYNFLDTALSIKDMNRR